MKRPRLGVSWRAHRMQSQLAVPLQTLLADVEEPEAKVQSVTHQSIPRGASSIYIQCERVRDVGSGTGHDTTTTTTTTSP